MIKQIDALAMGTQRLADVRAFYEQVLGMPPHSASERSVNYRLGTTDVAFVGGEAAQVACLIFGVGDLDAAIAAIEGHGVAVTRGEGTWAVLHDPEGREITLQGWGEAG